MAISVSQTLAGLDLKGLSAQHLQKFLESPVQNITSDSGAVASGTIFVAVRGGTHDGHRFIPDAMSKGALLVIGEDDDPSAIRASATPYLKVEDSRLALAKLAANFHGNPTHSMLTVGVTGTSGKTTTTYLIEAILAAAGYRVGVLGTVNFRYGGKVLPSTHTTPGPVETQAIIAEMKNGGCNAVVMEVSSHALKQHRAAFVEFDATAFSNLSPEHLDFHPDMDDYYRSKRLLFTRSAKVALDAGKWPVGAINSDDEWGIKLLHDLGSMAPEGFRVLTYGMGESGAKPQVSGAELVLSLEGIHGRIGDVEIHSSLVGRFNAYNILKAVAVAKGLAVPAEAIARGVAELKAVPGRLERVPNDKDIHVLVDYAHKPDALQKVLETLKRALCDAGSTSRLITVFGCGGDRDRKKRPVMGKIATDLSDLVFVTSDNPRTENPAAIIDEILAGIQGRTNFEVHADRKVAIHAALRAARPGDIVVIAGKGHEDYQVIADPAAPGGTRKIHFDDREVAAEALK